MAKAPNCPHCHTMLPVEPAAVKFTTDHRKEFHACTGCGRMSVGTRTRDTEREDARHPEPWGPILWDLGVVAGLERSSNPFLTAA